jgi:hypothetical protein
LFINKRLQYALYSPFFDKFEVIAYVFWEYISIAFFLIVPIVLLILKKPWIYILGSSMIGITIHRANKRSLAHFVLENMLKSEKFWGEMILAGIILVKDRENNIILPTPELSEKIVNEIKKNTLKKLKL